MKHVLTVLSLILISIALSSCEFDGDTILGNGERDYPIVEPYYACDEKVVQLNGHFDDYRCSTPKIEETLTYVDDSGKGKLEFAFLNMPDGNFPTLTDMKFEKTDRDYYSGGGYSSITSERTLTCEDVTKERGASNIRIYECTLLKLDNDEHDYDEWHLSSLVLENEACGTTAHYSSDWIHWKCADERYYSSYFSVYFENGVQVSKLYSVYEEEN